MTSIRALVFAALFSAGGIVSAQEAALQRPLELEFLDADSVDLKDFLWIKRPVVVFADTPADPRVIEQLGLLRARPDPLIERDVVVIIDADRSTPSELRNQLRPRGFMMVVMGKDGQVKLRKPSPWDVREISRSIDKMPLRQQEIRANR